MGDAILAQSYAARYRGLRELMPFAGRYEKLTELWRGEEQKGGRCEGHVRSIRYSDKTILAEIRIRSIQPNIR